MHCPNQVAVSFQFGKAVNFLVNACACCPLRARCTTSKTGRRVSTHPDAQLPQKLRQGQVTVAGRAELRERVGSGAYSRPHQSMALLDRTRYLGSRKNLFDLWRMTFPQPVVEDVDKTT